LQTIVKAFQYALERHAGQLRKDNSTPYIVHPFRVFLWLADEAKIYDEKVLAAAFLHDLIEDTTTDYDDINKEFDKEIADIVSVLTKDKSLPERIRERRFNEKLANADWKAKVVKLADVYDNLCDMENWNINKMEKLSKLKEKREQLKFVGRNLPDKYEHILKSVEDRLRITRRRVQGKK
jgi:guanosine-3',5'-bis(diphosphate) 3'-pyrophosphohydrolase